MRDYTNFDKYLDELYEDIYPQPEDPGHTAWAKSAISSMMFPGIRSVLDVGCGTGFASEIFNKTIYYEGITASEQDVQVGECMGRNVHVGDMSFLQYDNEEFDMIFARHVLEHSPHPIITLKEWYRVSRRYLFLIAPSPDFWGVYGRNHFSVLYKNQLWWVLKVAGWKVVNSNEMTTADISFIEHYSENQKKIKDKESLDIPPGPPQIVEYRFLCEKE